MHIDQQKPNKEAQHNDKENKNKGKKIDRHCSFCDRDGHIESIFFKKMEALEASMKKHNSTLILLQHHLRDKHFPPLCMHLLDQVMLINDIYQIVQV